jgi:hypothetical protein
MKINYYFVKYLSAWKGEVNARSGWGHPVLEHTFSYFDFDIANFLSALEF